ncbi:putative HAD hydrolase, subfamily IA, phosphoglycolate phosphatase-like, domain 2, HAD superfamily [Helianthus annuus]|uniref:HAD hydrolase, subfamily IA, phosphoglycolate phosphatase-like, domain 2, HAD superfamily n=1 Tax=Helianthus annuus TaxID=4232 RepID=A0A251S5U6_HELAN|nr:haloacid dehalogenase-like hydrolase domain-containing protein At4g39970 [Helianthus annuus]KAF5763251.1 putative HAD hydrolase, subfamily IA, phosphoglycolate phosphatase-like, domain 2, HAD superfamily [Helianthus annuus]KAJ0471934.1 putative phosphoglycolate phosphatase-like, domain 2, HAD superfamily [Helianthus annuus]KAJ0651415.1 putative phosphoglycolate phosphatase-like, domain 2, HAD superfamily [Helianthus annuus]KAJ0829992.1 putative phosphoglycolate phosphatase-like, domain 2, HA
MASNTILFLSPPTVTRHHTPLFTTTTTTTSLRRIPQFSSYSFSTRSSSSRSISATSRAMEALIFDCDGVILESEDLHRQAYNLAFAHFDVRCPPFSEVLDWGTEFYDVLQNQVGGGKPKMRWYFKENGWPTSTLFPTPPESDADRAKLIDVLQDWKTEKYKDILKSGTVEPRPGVLRLMDEARASGKKLAVCSAATKSSVILCLESLIGMERFQSLDCFLAGDDVKEKKPDPSIYITACKMLGVSEKACLVVEDSVIGLQAATKAGMSCVITYTSSTAEQDFTDAIAKYPDLSDVRLKDLEEVLQNAVTA